MNIEQLREELKRDEGCVNAIYLDHLNLPTIGIGHLVTEWDEEHVSQLAHQYQKNVVMNYLIRIYK